MDTDRRASLPGRGEDHQPRLHHRPSHHADHGVRRRGHQRHVRPFFILNYDFNIFEFFWYPLCKNLHLIRSPRISFFLKDTCNYMLMKNIFSPKSVHVYTIRFCKCGKFSSCKHVLYININVSILIVAIKTAFFCYDLFQSFRTLASCLNNLNKKAGFNNLSAWVPRSTSQATTTTTLMVVPPPTLQRTVATKVRTRITPMKRTSTC